jgi:hypothetical protein
VPLPNNFISEAQFQKSSELKFRKANMLKDVPQYLIKSQNRKPYSSSTMENVPINDRDVSSEMRYQGNFIIKHQSAVMQTKRLQHYQAT